MFNFPSFLFLLFPVQEEIKIIEVEVFVNPYTEPDEEDEKKSNEEKKVEDEENVSSGSNLKSWFPPPRPPNSLSQSSFHLLFYFWSHLIFGWFS